MRVVVNVVRGRGVPASIELDAASVAEARAQATRHGYSVLSCRATGIGLGAYSLSGSVRSNQTEAIIFVEQLRDLLLAGLSVVEALDALRRGASGDFLHVVAALEQDLRAGLTLSEALGRQAVFPPLLMEMARSAELTSDLPDTLGRFLAHARRVAEIRHRLLSASIYPLLLTGVGLLVMTFLFLYVMPRFARIFEGMTRELPWSARLMVAWAHVLGEHSALLLLASLSIAFAAAAILALPSTRSRAAGALLRWTPLRSRLRTYFLARWYRTTGMLVTGGIPLPEALHLSSRLLPESLMSSGDRVEQGVRNGLAPSAAHAAAGMATPVAERLMLAGERTGDLGSVLTRIAEFHESEFSRMLEQTMRVLEPVVMVAIGLGVGLVVVLMYMPIFELASAIR